MAGQRVELPPYSQFSATPVYTVATEAGPLIVFGLAKDVVVADATDVRFKVPPGAEHRLDLISQQFYGTPHLWHVLARVNNLMDPLDGFALGAVIRVPTKARLASEGLLNV